MRSEHEQGRKSSIMSRFGRILEAVTSGLYVALVAPPLAATAFALGFALTHGASAESIDTSVTSLLLLALGLATGAYFLGAVPAFLAGLALPFLLIWTSRPLASAACGVLGACAYLLTFGSHLLGQSPAAANLLLYALPACLGTSLAAYAYSRPRAKAQALAQGRG